MKNCSKVLGTPDYGSRVDALCLSTEVLGIVDRVDAGMFWLYPKNGNYAPAVTFDVVANKGAPFMIPLDLTVFWNKRFVEIGGKHKCVSSGLASVIIAAHYHEPESITLAGFDTLLDPSIPFTRNDAIARTGTGDIPHDWETENKLLLELSDHYKFEIRQL